MRMDDVRAMGRVWAVPFNVIVGQADIRLLPANPNRVAIVIGTDNATVTWLNFFGLGATKTGLPLSLTGGILQLGKLEFGQLVTQELRAFADGAANINVGGFEVILRDDRANSVQGGN